MAPIPPQYSGPNSSRSQRVEADQLPTLSIPPSRLSTGGGERVAAGVGSQPFVPGMHGARIA
jgi:hypothetical protein